MKTLNRRVLVDEDAVKEFDDWWDAKQLSFGGDDGVEYLKADEVIPHLGREWFVIDMTPSEYGFSSEGKPFKVADFGTRQSLSPDFLKVQERRIDWKESGT